MQFNRVEIERDLDDLSDEELQATFEALYEAHEANQAAFEQLTEDIDGDLDSVVQDFASAKSELMEEVVENSPLTEDEISGASFSRLRELHEEFVTAEPEEEEKEFEDMGQQGPTHNGDAVPEFAKQTVSEIPGVNVR